MDFVPWWGNFNTRMGENMAVGKSQVSFISGGTGKKIKGRPGKHLLIKKFVVYPNFLSV